MAQRPRMRPRFRLAVPGDGRNLMEQIDKQLNCEDCKYHGQVRGEHAFVTLPEGRQSLLSPHLTLELAAAEGDRRELRGRFSPRPNVWTGFMAVYGFIIMCGLTGLIYGWAQTTVDEYPWGFWAVPAAAALYAFVYGAAVIGQGLTADEMYELRAFVDHAMDEIGAPRTPF
jgi:hypothetical protein